MSCCAAVWSLASSLLSVCRVSPVRVFVHMQPCNSFTSSGSEGSADKRRRFELMRRQHYNMRDALVKVGVGVHTAGSGKLCVTALQARTL